MERSKGDIQTSTAIVRCGGLDAQLPLDPAGADARRCSHVAGVLLEPSDVLDGVLDGRLRDFLG